MVIHAGAGYGKTTLVQQWLDSNDTMHACWYALDEEDNDQHLFVAYLVKAVDAQQPLSENLLNLSRSGCASPMLLVKRLAYELSVVVSPLYLFFDDFHRVDSYETLNLLRLLIDSTPANIRFVFTSRSELPAQLSRSLLSNSCFYLSAENLALLDSETEEYVCTNLKFVTDRKDIRELHRLVEGWIAGIKLMALTADSHSSFRQMIRQGTLSNSGLSGYLTCELLAALPRTVQQFLSDIAVVERFDFELASRLALSSDVTQCLSYMKRHQIFLVELDSEGKWFRLHHLVTEFLRERLKQQDLSRWQTLNGQVAKYYFDSGLYSDAVHHCELSSDVELAISFLTGTTELADRGLYSLLSRLFNMLPKDKRESNLKLMLDYSLVEILRGDLFLGKQHLGCCKKLLQQQCSGDADWGSYYANWAQYHLLRADYAESRGVANQALELLTVEHPAFHLAKLVLAAALYDLGEIEQAIICLRQHLPMLVEQRRLEGALWGYAFLSHLLMMNGQLSEAAVTNAAGADFARRYCLEYSDNMYFIHLFAGFIYLQQLELPTADQHLRQALQIADCLPQYFQEQLLPLRCRLQQIKGRQSEVTRLITEMEVRRVDAARTGLRIHFDELLTGYWLRQEQHHKLVDWLGEETTAKGYGEKYLVWLRQQARASQAMGENEKALRQYTFAVAEAERLRLALEQLYCLDALIHICAELQNDSLSGSLMLMVSLAAKQRNVAVFMYDKTFYLPRLKALVPSLEEGGVRVFAQRLLSVLRQGKQLTGKSQVPHAALLFGITAKEWRVLTLICDGLSNEQITEQTHTSINTLKSHIQRAYKKLGVRSRRQAIERVPALLIR
ncbi:hypothetical protein EZV61_14625 [Corallincola luteus]|uniref:HTH luxR-type domain-containing protein n=1 Tax=Corallincola luteus TaxID=1775177 RepID=A0ABY2AJM0_9GAMM|nr:LuxR C-terminal-related transcriptional regulator [Corallincola luteus]TCI02170.1 hypothetical protein EZV61_14625 [Corallincola luteus]